MISSGWMPAFAASWLRTLLWVSLYMVRISWLKPERTSLRTWGDFVHTLPMPSGFFSIIMAYLSPCISIMIWLRRRRLAAVGFSLAISIAACRSCRRSTARFLPNSCTMARFERLPAAAAVLTAFSLSLSVVSAACSLALLTAFTSSAACLMRPKFLRIIVLLVVLIIFILVFVISLIISLIIVNDG